MAKVVYVAGYGRSGSTVLDILLGSHPSICSVGEVAFLTPEVTAARPCACGEPYTSCPFWKEFTRDLCSRVGRSSTERLRAVESRRSLPRLLLNRVRPALASWYRDFNRETVDYVLSKSNASVIVDSSKSGRWTAGRPLALDRLAGLDVYLLHLVRDGADTVRSYVQHGSNWALEGKAPPPTFPALRASVGWVLAHLSTLAVKRRLGARRCLTVRYEELIRDPNDTLRTIGRWIDVDLSHVADRAEAGATFLIGHNVGGNRVRRKERVRLRGSTASQTPLRYRLLFGLVGGWLQHRMEARRT